MQLGGAKFELLVNVLDTLLDFGIVGAVACDKLFENCPQSSRSQQQV